MADTHGAECRRWLVSGRVQGVFFRASTREVAVALGLDGSARNLVDGRVEVIAQGSPERLQRLAVWLRQGPPAARVEALDERPCSERPGAGFTTG